jgi:N-acetyl-gamma-glutamyl-phosphate reductase
MKVGVVGASGYAGGELLRLLSSHEHFDLTYIAAGSAAGSSIISLHPQLVSFQEQLFEPTDVKLMNACDLIFFALPHGESSKLVSAISSSTKIVDLGADFRLRSAQSWGQYYDGEHAGSWVYGLPEIAGNRDRIARSERVANPGCYATAISLAAAPAIAHGLIDSSDIVVVAASGTTGAGRKPAPNLLASEVMGSISSYKFGGVHQHTPEIEEALASIADSTVRVSFTPMLAPMTRGILATTTATMLSDHSTVEIHALYREYYAGSPFVTVLPAGTMPQTVGTIGSNNALMQVAVDHHSNRLIVSSALDNLGKGAASQAIQNANLMCQFDETTGLSGNSSRA